MHDPGRTRIDRITAETDPEGQKANVDILLRGSLAYTPAPKGFAGQIVRVWELVPKRIFQRSRM
jgi:hypothetical protein